MTDRVWCPFAVSEQLDQSDGADYGGPLTVSHGLVLHVQDGDGSPGPWFDRPSVQASSHWWVGKTGRLEQYVPGDAQSWAQVAGNAGWHSVETEGRPEDPLTGDQIYTLGRLYAWGADADVWGWPLQVCDVPAGRGLGIHSMGGAAWGGHACPGPIRAGQRADILAAAGGPTAGGVSMSEVDDALNKASARGFTTFAEMFKAEPGGVIDMLRVMFDREKRVETAVTDLAAKQATLNAAFASLVDPKHPVAAALGDPTAALVVQISGITDVADAVLVVHAAASRLAALVPPAPPTGGS